MRRCRYAAMIRVLSVPLYVRCARRNVLGSAGWHLHDASLPPGVAAGGHVRVRWRSTQGPDYHIDYLRDGIPVTGGEGDGD